MCEHRSPQNQNDLKRIPVSFGLVPGSNKVRHTPGPTQSLFLYIGVYFRHNSEQRLPKSNTIDFTNTTSEIKYDRFHQYLVVYTDFSENKQPQKKIKTVTMDKTL